MNKILSIDGTILPKVTLRCELIDPEVTSVDVSISFKDSSVKLTNCTFNGETVVDNAMNGILEVSDPVFSIEFSDATKVTNLGNSQITILGRGSGANGVAKILNPEVLKEFVNANIVNIRSNNIGEKSIVDLTSLKEISRIFLTVYNMKFSFIDMYFPKLTYIYAVGNGIYVDFRNCPNIEKIQGASPLENTYVNELSCQETLKTLKCYNIENLKGDIAWFANCPNLTKLNLCSTVNVNDVGRRAADMYGDIMSLPKTIKEFAMPNQPNITFQNVTGDEVIFNEIVLWNSKRYFMDDRTLTKVLKAISKATINSTTKICMYGDVPEEGSIYYNEYNTALNTILGVTTYVSISGVFANIENYRFTSD